MVCCALLKWYSTAIQWGLFPLCFKSFLDVIVEVSQDGKKLSLLQLEKLYQDWMLQMHDLCDGEIDSGEDQPTFVLNPSHKKELGVTSDGIDWKQKRNLMINS